MLGRQQSDDECAARRAAVKTRTADVAATGYRPSDEGRRISTVGRDLAVTETPSSVKTGQRVSDMVRAPQAMTTV